MLAPEWLAALRFPVVLIRRSEEFTILYSLYMRRYYKGQRKGIWEGLLLSDTPYLPQLNPWPFWHPPTASFTKAPGMTLLPGSGGSTSREGPVMAQCKCYSKFFFLLLGLVSLFNLFLPHSNLLVCMAGHHCILCCAGARLVSRMCLDCGGSSRKRPEINPKTKPSLA